MTTNALTLNLAKVIVDRDMRGSCESDCYFENLLVELCEEAGLVLDPFEATDYLYEAMDLLEVDRCVHCSWIISNPGVDDNGECTCDDCASELEDE